MFINIDESDTMINFKVKFEDHSYTLVVDKKLEAVHLMRNSKSQWCDYQQGNDSISYSGDATMNEQQSLITKGDYRRDAALYRSFCKEGAGLLEQVKGGMERPLPRLANRKLYEQVSDFLKRLDSEAPWLDWRMNNLGRVWLLCESCMGTGCYWPQDDSTHPEPCPICDGAGIKSSEDQD